ncbi:hypothetical protein RhiJN_02002 [Ceratobasidium sp. AG-Ba]|nr:hypothetical protein RhiJN_02002 [Ceratobasidium sp. AG-Ba]QRW02936.1 hypothetical protein RhiLY_01935 [Ceratobasidium sp. AG-Ba]
MAEHVPRPRHNTDELHARGIPKGRGGVATWYQPGLGNCGGYNSEKDMIVALPTKVYSKGKYCNKKIRITNKKNGKSCTATVVDSCPGCDSQALDVSPAVFKAIGGPLGNGVFNMDWDLV